jgi:eukaryotic-like serine/threonine-protein kinase
MKILIVDDSIEFRKVLKIYIAKQLTEAEVIEYDLDKFGIPDTSYNWGEYDLLLLDYNLGGEEDGFTWLITFRETPNFPPVIILTADSSEYIAVKAIKLGAADFINKSDLTPDNLAQAINRACAYRNGRINIQNEGINLSNKVISSTKKQHEKEILYDIPYKLVRLIGQGASSNVYLAERESDRLTIVLKVMDINVDTDNNALNRFMLEADLLTQIKSTFVAKIYDYGLTDEYGFIAMEFFNRGDLKQRMDLDLSLEDCLSYITHIAYGLRDIHDMGVVHRDIKPANIMFRGDGSLAIADFGISKRLYSPLDMTTLGKVLGTPHYLSPEQGQGKKVDQRSDIYSVGVLLYELLTREKPYTANTPAALIYQHINAPLPVLTGDRKIFQRIIKKTMAKNPVDRYQTMDGLIFDLEKVENKLSVK